MKDSNDTIGNQTHALPVCSAVPTNCTTMCPQQQEQQEQQQNTSYSSCETLFEGCIAIKRIRAGAVQLVQ
jgi:hypothetical protein